jgi:fatty-acyl-CoA synthase
VAEAATFAVPHPRWLERPMSVVVLKDGLTTTEDELRDYLAEQFPRWWLPDRIAFIDVIPKTATGKFQKFVLRDEYRDALIGVEETNRIVTNDSARHTG